MLNQEDYNHCYRIWFGMIVIAFILTITAIIAPHVVRNEYTIQVLYKEQIPYGTEKANLITAKTDQGSVKEFIDWQSPLENVWHPFGNSLEVNKTYRIKTYGWRWQTFDSYETIIDVKPM